MYARSISTSNTDFVEKIIYNIRDTPLKSEMIECIKDLPDEILLTVKPLMMMLIENTTTIEEVSFDELSESEKQAHAIALEELARGETVSHDDMDWD